MAYKCRKIAEANGVSLIEEDCDNYADLILTAGDYSIHLSLEDVDALIPILQKWAARQHEKRALLIKPQPVSVKVDGIDI